MTPLQHNLVLGIMSINKHKKIRANLQKSKKNGLGSRNFQVMRKD